MMGKGDLEFGDIVLVSCDPSIGHEFKGKRPVIVIQSNEQLERSNLVTIVPLTSNRGNTILDDIMVVMDSDNSLRTDSVAIKLYLKRHFDL